MLLIQQPSLILSNDIFCNRHGSIRVSLVRKHFGLYSLESGVKIQTKPLLLQDLLEIVDLCKSWRDTVEIMPLRFIYNKATYIDLKDTPSSPESWIDNYNIRTGKIAVRFNEKSDIVCYETEVPEWKLIKSCKRGNDVYIRQVRKKFKPVIDAASNVKSFFSTEINKNRKRVRKTKLLYITGTVDRDKTGTIGNSWLKFGTYWNSFITNIREQFNGAEYIRAWQSQQDGYPHFHALVFFKNFKFTVTPWQNEKGKWEFRVHNRQKHNGKYVRDKLKDAWKWGNLDVKCCDNTKKALVDIVKYITRDLKGGKSDLTNGMVWYFGKQSYSISKNFVKGLLGKNIDLAEPSNDDLINAFGVIQRNNSKKNLVRIEVFPLIRRDLIPNFTQLNLDNWADPPDPPPEIIDFLENIADQCKPISSRKNEEGIDIIVYDWKDMNM